MSYILLAKIEEFALKSKYNEEYLKYINSTSFMFPFFNINKKHENYKNNMV